MTAKAQQLACVCLKAMVLAMFLRGRRAGVYRSLQIAIRGRFRGCTPLLPFLVKVPAEDADESLLLLPWTSFSRAFIAPLPSDPPSITSLLRKPVCQREPFLCLLSCDPWTMILCPLQIRFVPGRTAKVASTLHACLLELLAL